MTARSANADGESPLGDVIADAQLEATAPTDFGGAVIAFMNPGGIRAPLLSTRSRAASSRATSRTARLFNVQPFGNTLTVKTCNGAQIQALLEQQFVVADAAALPAGLVRLQLHLGQHAAGRRQGAQRDREDQRRARSSTRRATAWTMNNFLADGGDGFCVFNQCTNQLGGEVDLDAFGRYFSAHSPVSPPPYLTAPRSRGSTSERETRCESEGPGDRALRVSWGYTGSLVSTTEQPQTRGGRLDRRP